MNQGYSDFFKKVQKNKNLDRSEIKDHLKEMRQKIATKKPEPRAFPWRGTIVSLLGCLIAVIGLNLDIEWDDLGIEFLAVQSAEAEGKEKSSDFHSSSSEHSSETKAEEDHNEMGSVEADEKENLSHVELLQREREAVRKKAAELKELERDLHKQKREVTRRLKELDRMRTEIAQMIETKQEQDDTKVGELVAVYQAMKPRNAAQVISHLDEKLAKEVIRRMKKDSAANVMNFLTPEKAQVLSESMAGYRR